MFEIGNVLGKAWEDFTKNAATLIVITLIVGGILGVFVVLGYVAMLAAVFGLIQAKAPPIVLQLVIYGGGTLFTVLVVATMQFLLLGYYAVCLKCVRGETPQIGELFGQMGKFVPGAILGAIHSFVGTLGTYMCFVPGFIWYLLTCFSQFFVLDRDMGPIDAIQGSIRATKGSRMNLFLLLFVLGLLEIPAAMTCGLGLLVWAPVACLSLARVYLVLSEAMAKEMA